MDVDVHLKNVSYSLFRVVDNWFGSDEIIRNRRMVRDIFDKILRNNSQAQGLAVYSLFSGSRAEGFRFATSDQDIMLVYTAVTVLPQVDPSYCRKEKETVLVSETNETRPGFCLLRLASISRYEKIVLSLVQLQNGLYVSSALWRNVSVRGIPESHIHGPCESGWMGGMETDFAHCLKCMKWPKSAFPSVRRLLNAKWPSTRILSTIVQSGCHLVPIGDKTSDREIMEWRISFSQAENSLIDEMRHCQFLCYGLLKVFLKEAIDTNEDVKGLLCSYFLKTSVLWTIVKYGASWPTEDILSWFWICYRQLINWVSNGYCPNFFISENNMFFGKIQGRSQQTLKNQLVTLYKEGYTCFLRCSSFRNDLEAIICQPNIGFLLPFDNGRIKVKTDLNLISDLSSNCSFSLEIHDLQRTVSLLHNFEGKYGSLAERSGTKVFLKFNIQYLLLSSLPSWFPDPRSSVNQGIYKSLSDVLNALKQSRFDATTHSILSAVLLYRIGMYRRVVNLGIKIKSRLKQTNVMYEWGLRDRKYVHEGGEIYPFDAMMKKVLSMTFKLEEGTCIQELSLEERSSSWGVFCPPMAIIGLLLYLSFHKLSSYTEADSVLRDLAMAVNNTDNHHIPCFLRAISWEILGICQETGGYLHDAVHSYQRALMEPRHNYFREATLFRLQMLNTKMNHL